MREKFVQTGDEQFDTNLFKTYEKHLTSLMKVDKKLLSNMTDENKTLLFHNFFKFIQEAYYQQFGIAISEEDDIVDYATLLMAMDKHFAKKLAAYVNQYLDIVRLQLKRKQKLKQKQVKKLENIRKEALALAKYLFNPEMLKLMTLGHANQNGHLVDYRSNEAMNIRMKTIWKLRGFMQENNMFSGGNAEKVIHVPKMNPVTYKGIVKSFNPDVFYSLEKEDVLNLVEGLVDGYCSMNGVLAPQVQTGKFATSAGKTTLGTYADAVDTVYINEEILSKFDMCKKSKDPALPMRLMQISLHEARHKVQATNMNRDPENERDKKIAYAMNTSFNSAKEGNLDFASYLSTIEEADARYSALKTMQEYAESDLLDNSSKTALNALLKEETEVFRRGSKNQSIYNSDVFRLASPTTQKSQSNLGQA